MAGQPVQQGYPYLLERLRRALDIGDELRGTVLPGMVSTILSEDLTDPQYMWLRRGLRWEASCQDTPASGGEFSAALLWANPLVNSGVIRKILRIRSLRVWSRAATPQTVFWTLLNQGTAPAFTSAATHLPTPLDSRQGITATSLYRLLVGTQSVINVGNGSGYAGMIAPVNNPSGDIDPRISFRSGEAVLFTVPGLGTPFGMSIGWEERMASEQEWVGDV